MAVINLPTKLIQNTLVSKNSLKNVQPVGDVTAGTAKNCKNNVGAFKTVKNHTRYLINNHIRTNFDKF